jgi:hypothetical protein
MWAVAYGSRDVVSMLLDAGADVAPQWLLTQAWHRADHEITRLLQDYGARYSLVAA